MKVSAEYPADTEMLEWVCNEGANRSLVHWVGQASDERKNEVQVAPEILARYVGTSSSNRHSGKMCKVLVRRRPLVAL